MRFGFFHFTGTASNYKTLGFCLVTDARLSLFDILNQTIHLFIYSLTDTETNVKSILLNSYSFYSS